MKTEVQGIHFVFSEIDTKRHIGNQFDLIFDTEYKNYVQSQYKLIFYDSSISYPTYLT